MFIVLRQMIIHWWSFFSEQKLPLCFSLTRQGWQDTGQTMVRPTACVPKLVELVGLVKIVEI